MVQLKEGSYLFHRLAVMFQFRMVQLKAMWPGRLPHRQHVSIPHGPIKSSSFCRVILTGMVSIPHGPIKRKRKISHQNP